MMGNDYKWKINSYSICMEMLIALFVLYNILRLLDDHIFIYIVIIFILVWILLATFFNYTYVYVDKIVYFYPFRIWKRLVSIKYEQILNMSYTEPRQCSAKWRFFTLKIYTEQSSYLSFLDFMGKRKRQEMFDFFESKGIKVIRK